MALKADLPGGGTVKVNPPDAAVPASAEPIGPYGLVLTYLRVSVADRADQYRPLSTVARPLVERLTLKDIPAAPAVRRVTRIAR